MADAAGQKERMRHCESCGNYKGYHLVWCELPHEPGRIDQAEILFHYKECPYYVQADKFWPPHSVLESHEVV